MSGPAESSTDGYTFLSDPRLVLEMARSRLQTQLSFADALDAKLGATFAASSALLGLLAATIAFRGGGNEAVSSSALGIGEAVILSVALGFYVVAIIAAIAGWPRTWQIGPNVETAFEDSQSLPENDFIAKQASGYMDNWRQNRSRNTIKSWALRVSFVAVLGEAGAVIAAVWPVVF